MALGDRIVVVTWNTLNFLKPMVESIRSRYPYTVIVVDNNSSDGIDEWVKERVEAGWHFIKQPMCGSMGRNRNAGMKLAAELGCSHILISQEDVLLHKDLIDNAVRLHDEKGFPLTAAWPILHYDPPGLWEEVLGSSVGKAGLEPYLRSHLVDPTTGKPEAHERGKDYEYMKAETMERILAMSPEILRRLDIVQPREVYGSPLPVVCLVGREFVDTVGFYDDGYTEAAYEDADLIHRCALTVEHPDKYRGSQLCLYVHWGGASHMNNNVPWWRTKDRVMNASEQRYIRKWGGPIQQERWTTPIPQPDLWETEDSYLRLK